MSNASSNTPDLVPSNLPSAEEDRVRSSISEDIISGLSFIFEEVMWDLWTLKYKLLFKFFPSLISVPSLEGVEILELEKCPAVYDNTRREAKFALRTTDLPSWKQAAPGERNTNSDPKPIQHWAVVIYFPGGDETYLYEAWKDEDTGRLQPGRARYVNKEIFEKAEFIGTAMTSPSELLEIAKQVPTGSVVKNNCQKWLGIYLQFISPRLSYKLSVIEQYGNFFWITVSIQLFRIYSVIDKLSR